MSGTDIDNQTDETVNTEESYWASGLVIWTITSIIMLIVCIIQGYAMYSDLYTSQRNVLSHVRNKPKITGLYKSILISTYVSVVSFFFASVSGIWGHFTATVDECYACTIFFLITFQIAKCSMYCLFLLRLHVIYGNSVHAYNKYILLSICGVVVIVTFAIIFGELFGTIATVTSYSWSNTAYFCNGEIPFWCLILIGLIDICLSIGCLIAFIVPLRKILRAYTSSDSDATSAKTVSKMIFTAYKFTIITCVATCSTLIALVAFTLSGIAYFAAVDYIINSLCMILMTLYFPNKKYYLKLCCCCIYCCDRNGYSQETKWKQEAPAVAENYDKQLEPTTTIRETNSDQNNDTADNSPTPVQSSVDTDAAVKYVADQQIDPLSYDKIETGDKKDVDIVYE